MATQAEKDLHRAARSAHRARKQESAPAPVTPPTVFTPQDPVDCACVIHGSGYDFTYVDRLYSMLNRHLTCGARLHVYTEASRPVPAHMVRHDLTEWPGVSGRKRSWWYKMQLFNPAHFSGQLLYFDLDTVIVDNIDWIVNLSPAFFWTIKDFRRLQNTNWTGMNSSIMWWNVTKFDWVWREFEQKNLTDTIQQHRQGDQDYIMKALGNNNVRFFEDQLVQSWRWQVQDGGINFPGRRPIKPGTGTHISDNVSVLVFHGSPKPHEITDPKIVTLWV